MSNIHRKGFNKITLDNEEAYFSHLSAIIESVDELALVQITNSPNKLNVRIAPSLPKYTEMLLEELLRFHNLLQIRLILSKSIKSSGSIVFDIEL
jgi:hypothetical protein